MRRHPSRPGGARCVAYTERDGGPLMSRTMLRQKLLTSALTALMAATMLTGGLPAVAAEDDETELAKKTQNPVADLISVPLQNNFNFNTGFHHNKTIYVLNVQPVIPIKMNEDWN